MIQVQQLTKRYGKKMVVDDVSFVAPPGQVTGFLGPNGAGKSTTMRMIVGLDSPTSGTALVNGKRYADLKAPLQELGVLLEAKAIHPGRTAINHLMGLAYTHGIPRTRVDEVIDLAGLTAVADKRVGAFSLGMGQRLGIAAALLGDPAAIMLDEPVNGLDPEGVRWVRELLRGLAAQGRTVMLSSHLMSEMAMTADRLVVIGRGKLLADTTVAAMVEQSGGGRVRVATSEPERMRTLLTGPDVAVTSQDGETMIVTGLNPRQIGQLAADHQIPLYELNAESVSLEDAFMNLTRTAVEYHSADTSGATR